MRGRLLLLCLLSLLMEGVPASAGTPSGTFISNTATATFNDVVGSFTSISNTVSALVENVPALTITAQGNQNMTPGMIVTDTFILANSGNGTGTFALTGDATVSGTASGAVFKGYVLNGAASGVCSTALPCGYALLNAQSGMTGVAMGGTIRVGVEYQVPTTVSANQSVVSVISANIFYAASGSLSAATSPTESASSLDTVLSDARLDLQASASLPTGGGQPIVWTIVANDGAASPAYGSQAAQALLGASRPGIAIFLQIPTFGGVPLSLTAPPQASLNGALSGTSVTWYYSTATSAPSNSASWSTTFTSSAVWVAAYLSGGANGEELPSAPTQSSGVGSVSVPQLTLTITTAQPPGTTSASAMAVAALAGVPGVTGISPLIGPTVASGTQDAANGSLLVSAESNTTPSTGMLAPGGASNAASTQGSGAAGGLLNGPLGSPATLGSYPAAPNNGAASADVNHDFTAVVFTCANGGSANSCTVPTGGVNVPNTLENLGSTTDTITLTATPPSGWTVQLFNATCPAGPYSAVPVCTLGAAITSLSAAGQSASGTVSLTGDSTLTYVARYASATAVASNAALDATITATGTAGTSADTNDTHNDLYPGGVVQISVGSAVTSTNCSSTPAAGQLCPGGTLSFTIAYRNVAPVVAIGANAGTEPAFALAALQAAPGSIQIIDDGNAGDNTWGSATFGLNAAPSDTTPGTTYVYSGGSGAFSTGTYPNLTNGYTKFIATVGGSSYVLPPGGSGTITFTLTVR